MKRQSDYITRAFTTGGAHCQVECSCGRINFPEIPTGAAEYWQEEVDELKARQRSKPDSYICHDGCDTVSTYTIQGNVFAAGCPCNSLAKLEDFLLTHREEVLRYYLALKEARKNSDQMLEQLGA